MSTADISLKLEVRNVLGKGLNKLRSEGNIPAVIHDHGKESIHVMAGTTQINKVYQTAGKHHPVNLTVGDKKYMALIKDIDFEPRKHVVRHVVFNAIAANEKQQTEVPIKLVGDAPAEKAGLLVIHVLDTIELEALPKDLIDEIEIDVSGLTEIGDKLTVADLKLPAGVELITEPEHTIAVVEETPAQVSEEAEAENAEGEVPADNGGGDTQDTSDKSEADKSDQTVK